MERAQQTGSPGNEGDAGARTFLAKRMLCTQNANPWHLRCAKGVSKWDIRHKIWDYMEANNLADFPRPVHHRIPNFKDAPRASARLPDLQEFQSARTVKVNPDAPQKNARFLALEARKALLVPTPRLRTGLFNRIIPPPGATKEMLRKCATSQGVRDYSVPVGLDSKVHVDLVVVGSVAVSEKGFRIGKGEGFADLEYAMMVSMGAVREDTVVVTAVHDCQVVDIPEDLLGDHDLTVDYILTPTRIIKTGCNHPKPQGILWHKLARNAAVAELKRKITTQICLCEQMAGRKEAQPLSQDQSRNAGEDPSPQEPPPQRETRRQGCCPQGRTARCSSC
uniref:methenyltetrahydrofolate synthase domain-containing protein isoform X7 n=1 Tax=Podarcis muralis TaxID=64176 RepID=UPI00109F440E|nr:methenyltetrahydrofolate synthase domain-containing protein isoform X7 [Podarcis muralis]